MSDQNEKELTKEFKSVTFDDDLSSCSSDDDDDIKVNEGELVNTLCKIVDEHKKLQLIMDELVKKSDELKLLEKLRPLLMIPNMICHIDFYPFLKQFKNKIHYCAYEYSDNSYKKSEAVLIHIDKLLSTSLFETIMNNIKNKIFMLDDSIVIKYLNYDIFDNLDDCICKYNNLTKIDGNRNNSKNVLYTVITNTNIENSYAIIYFHGQMIYL
jgi:hypothetical protein